MDHRRHDLDRVDIHQGDENKHIDGGQTGVVQIDAPPKPQPEYANHGIHQIVCTALQQCFEYITIGRYESALLRISHDRSLFPLLVNVRKGEDGQFQADSGDVDISGGGSSYTMYVVNSSALPVAEAAELYLLDTLFKQQVIRVDVLVQLRHGSKTDNLRGSSDSPDGQLHKDNPVAGV